MSLEPRLARPRVRLLSATGNAFHVWNALDGVAPDDPAGEARRLCAASGRDGLLVVTAEPGATCRMHVVNADGSRAETCGNGLRCVAVMLADEGLAPDGRVTIATDAGTVRAELLSPPGDAGEPGCRVRVGMGEPGAVDSLALELPGERLELLRTRVGNPHAVLFGDARLLERLEELGPRIERDATFPERTNVELATLLPMEGRTGGLRARVWERGVGETRSCGSGATAAALAAVATGRAAWPVAVAMPGGTLEIDLGAAGLTLTGPVD